VRLTGSETAWGDENCCTHCCTVGQQGLKQDRNRLLTWVGVAVWSLRTSATGLSRHRRQSGWAVMLWHVEGALGPDRPVR
jgi:hypothetical protein